MFNPTFTHHQAWIAAGAAAIALLAAGAAGAGLAIDGQPTLSEPSAGLLQIDIVRLVPGEAD